MALRCSRIFFVSSEFPDKFPSGLSVDGENDRGCE